MISGVFSWLQFSPRLNDFLWMIFHDPVSCPFQHEGVIQYPFPVGKPEETSDDRAITRLAFRTKTMDTLELYGFRFFDL